MKLLDKYKFILLLFLLFIFLDTIFYWGIWNTFFQQDEWALFGRTIYQLQNLPVSLIRFSGIHFHPLGSTLWMILYYLFGLNAAFYGFFTIIIHSATALVSYYYFKIFIKQGRINMLLSLLFLLSYPTTQVVNWFAVSPYVIPCIALTMLFFILLNRFTIDDERFSRERLIILFSVWFVALLFREEASIAIPLSVAFIWLFRGKKYFLKSISKISAFVLLMTLIIIIRFGAEYFFGEKRIYEQGSQSVMIAYNLLLTPFKMIIENIIDLHDLWKLSYLYGKLAFPFVTDGLVIERVFFEHIVVFLIIPIIGLSFYLFPKMDKNKKSIFYFSLLWIMFASFIISIQSRRLYFLESRYLYLGSIGVGIFLYSLFSTIKFSGIFKTKFKLIVIFLSGIFIIYSFVNIRQNSKFFLSQSFARKSIINQIISLHKTIPRTAVFYFECENKINCLPNGFVLPFQSGTGEMLLTIYASKNLESRKLYAPFLSSYFLWDLGSEGFRRIDGVGFGFYLNKNNLLKAVRNKLFNAGDVLAFSYNLSQNKITEISSSFRTKIEEDLSQ